jgi:hypothetical protein
MTAPPVPTGLILANGKALVDGFGSWLIINQGEAPPPPPPGPPPGTPLGSFRFLNNHYVDGEYILAGDIRDMFAPWVPTADVEPLDTTALNYFYARGPTLGAVIRTHFSHIQIYAPRTYWRSVTPNVWGLTGLGSGLLPIPALLSRVEDKEA